MRKTLAVLFIVGVAVMANAATRTVDFTQDTVDQPPKGFEFGHTANAGKPGRWIVQADGSNKVLALSPPNTMSASRLWPRRTPLRLAGSATST